MSAIHFSTLVGPPALVPLYFQWYVFYFVVQRKQWVVSELHVANGAFSLFYRYISVQEIGRSFSLFSQTNTIETYGQRKKGKVAEIRDRVEEDSVQNDLLKIK